MCRSCCFTFWDRLWLFAPQQRVCVCVCELCIVFLSLLLRLSSPPHGSPPQLEPLLTPSAWCHTACGGRGWCTQSVYTSHCDGEERKHSPAESSVFSKVAVIKYEYVLLQCSWMKQQQHTEALRRWWGWTTNTVFTLWPLSLLPLLDYTSLSHNASPPPSLHPSIRALRALTRWCCCTGGQRFIVAQRLELLHRINCFLLFYIQGVFMSLWFRIHPIILCFIAWTKLYFLLTLDESTEEENSVSITFSVYFIRT